MSRRLSILAVPAFLVLVALAATGAMGYKYLKHQRLLDAFDQAEIHFQNGEWMAAKRRYAFYLSSDRTNNSVLRKYAEASERLTADRSGTLRDASVAYYQISLNDPSDASVVEELIRIHTKRRAWGDLQFFSKLFLQDMPDNETLLYHRALALDKLGRWDEAVEAYRDAIAGGTGRPEAYGGLARLLWERDLTAQGEAVLDDAIVRDPGNCELYVERAKMFFESGELEDAERALSAARDLEPNNWRVLVAASRLALERNDVDEAYLLAVRAHASTEAEDEANLALLAAFERRGEYEEAIWVIEGLDPYTRADNPMYYLALGQLMLMQGRLDDFEGVLAEYREVYPNHVVMFDYLEARALLTKGSAAHAAAKLTTIVETRPDFREAQYYLAVAHLRAQRRDRASSVLESYLRHNPEDVQARFLFDQEFGGADSVAEIREGAVRLLKSETAPLGSLLATARLLANVERGSSEGWGIALALLERALDQGGAGEEALELLIQVLLFEGDVSTAETRMATALDEGMSRNKLRLSLAGIALAAGREDEARRLFESHVSENDLTVDELVRWSSFYAVRGALDVAMDVLEPAIVAAEAEKRFALRTSQIDLNARYGQVDRAVSILEGLEQGEVLALDAETRDLLNQHKEGIVRELLRRQVSHDSDLALKLIRELELDEPENTKLKLLHISVLFGARPPELEAAGLLVDSLVRSDPTNPRVWMMRSELSARDGNLLDAHGYAERAAALSPDSPEIQLFLGGLRMDLENFDEAQPPLERALSLNPDDSRATELLVRAYIETGRVAQAEMVLGRLERGAPSDSEVSGTIASLRARIMLAKGLSRAQISVMLREKYEENSNDMSLLNDLVVVLVRAGNVMEAEALLAEFTDRHGDSAVVWTALGRFYMAEHAGSDDRKASAALTRALVLEPRFAPAMRGMIALQVQLDRWAEALLLSHRYLTQYPDDPVVLHQAAILVFRLKGPTSEATGLVTRAIGLRERDEYYFLRASMRLDQSAYEDALGDLQQIDRYRVRNSATLDLALAEAYLGVREYELARQYFESALGASSKGEAVSAERLSRLRSLLEKEGGQA